MYLEALNLTGIPSVVLLPTIGSFSHYGTYSFWVLLLISVVASMLGNVTYYTVARIIGPPLYDFFYKKFKGIRKSLDRAKLMSEKYGNSICLVGRIIPGVRSVISLLAGAFEIKIVGFCLYSLVGVSLWNIFFMAIGYWIGKTV